MSIIGERIKTARLERGINQRNLCLLADITETTLSRYENGTREPQASAIGKIAKILNVSTDYLIGNVDDIKYKTETEVKVVSNEINYPLQYRVMENRKYGYIKTIVSDLKNESGHDVYKLASDYLLTISYLDDSINYNFKGVYNNAWGRHFLFLNPNISELEAKVIIIHMIGYITLFNNPNTYYFYDFINSNTFEVGQKSNIFAAEYLIDDDIFIRALALGDDNAIANELQVPVNFIEHKRNLITK